MGEANTDRRTFIGTAGAVAAGIAAGTASAAGSSRARSEEPVFKLDYAPHFGMFNAVSGNDDLIRRGGKLFIKTWPSAGFILILSSWFDFGSFWLVGAVDDFDFWEFPTISIVSWRTVQVLAGSFSWPVPLVRF